MSEKEVKKEKKPAAKKETKKTAKAAKKSKKEKLVNLQSFDIIRSPIVTEKSTLLGEYNKISFKVGVDAKKSAIKRAIEELFEVKVNNVNTIKVKGKTKTFRGKPGKRPDYKKAIVSLAEGHTVDVMTGVK